MIFYTYLITFIYLLILNKILYCIIHVLLVSCMYHHIQGSVDYSYDLCNDGGGIFDSKQYYMFYIRGILFSFMCVLLDFLIHVPQN